jgi:flagella basal body P-ring formation protein FlgA
MIPRSIRRASFLLFIAMVAGAPAAIAQSAEHPSSISAAPSAPSPRTLVLIDRPVVELKDLFHHAGINADAVLGPAPLPGARIVVGSRQLAAIALRYGVAWFPGDSDQSVSIERPGSPIGHDRIVAAVSRALRQAGAAGHVAINLEGEQLPMVPPNSRPDISIDQMVFDRNTGAFRAIAHIAAPRMDTVTTTIGGVAKPETQRVIAIHDLTRGDILNDSDVRLTWVAQDDDRHDAIRTLSRVIGMQVSQSILKGMPLSRRMIADPILVARGATVSLAVDMPGLEVTAQGVALAAGGSGHVIPVINPSSHEIVQAVVDGPDHAHVLPGSMPTRGDNANPYYDLAGRQP